jgi:hypothetical protein
VPLSTYKIPVLQHAFLFTLDVVLLHVIEQFDKARRAVRALAAIARCARFPGR